jgi:hypothetical protein
MDTLAVVPETFIAPPIVASFVHSKEAGAQIPSITTLFLKLTFLELSV